MLSVYSKEVLTSALGDEVASEEISTAIDYKAVAGLALAEGSIIVGDATGFGSALDAKGNAKILIGNGTTITSAVLSSEASMNNAGAVTLANAAVIGKLLTGFVSGAGVVAAGDTILQAINKLDGNEIASAAVAAAALPSASFTDAAVTSKLITGFVSGAGAVGAGDTILQAINKLDGNVALRLASASFTDAAVTSKVLTGFSSGAGAVADTDTILQGINKLDGNIALKWNSSNYVEDNQSLTFDHAVGATVCPLRMIGKTVVFEIPAIGSADGLGTVVSSGAGDLEAAYRPLANIDFPIHVTDAAGTHQVGLLRVGSNGTVTMGSTIANAVFTNAQAWAFLRQSFSWTIN